MGSSCVQQVNGRQHIEQWGACKSNEGSAFFQTTEYGRSYVSGGSKKHECIGELTHKQWNWFRLERAGGGEFSAYWNSATSQAVPSSGWQLLSKFSLSNAPVRVGHSVGSLRLGLRGNSRSEC